MLGQLYVQELQYEMISMAKMLARLPNDKLNWKPHEKSMTLGQLAAHTAEIPDYILKIIKQDGIDFASDYTPLPAESSEQLQAAFQQKCSEATAALLAVSDETLYQNWTMRNGDQIIAVLPRVGAIRSVVFSHFIHHRGQLSVYLRMLDIPVPSIYGPSADEAV